MFEIAQALGKSQETKEYAELFNNIKRAFQQKYVKPDGILTVDTQTAYALAIFVELLPDDLRAKAGARLAQKIADNDGLMGTGFLGTKCLLSALSSVDRHDLATKLFQSHKYPSWSYEIDQGATTIWERWNSYTKEDGFAGGQNAAMNSFSHYSFGAVCEWMFSNLAGIDSYGPGFKEITIRPMPPSPKSNPDHQPINWVRAHYDSIRGRIETSWKREGDEFQLDLTIPPNTTATVFLPTNNRTTIKEGGQGLEDAKGVKLFRVRDDVTVLAVESGQYHFACKATP
jgi:alpha-L-rhamnosidase